MIILRCGKSTSCKESTTSTRSSSSLTHKLMISCDPFPLIKFSYKTTTSKRRSRWRLIEIHSDFQIFWYGKVKVTANATYIKNKKKTDNTTKMRTIDKLKQPITLKRGKMYTASPCAQEMTLLFNCWRTLSLGNPGCESASKVLMNCIGSVGKVKVRSFIGWMYYDQMKIQSLLLEIGCSFNSYKEFKYTTARSTRNQSLVSQIISTETTLIRFNHIK